MSSIPLMWEGNTMHLHLGQLPYEGETRQDIKLLLYTTLDEVKTAIREFKAKLFNHILVIDYIDGDGAYNQSISPFVTIDETDIEGEAGVIVLDTTVGLGWFYDEEADNYYFGTKAVI